MKPSPLKTQTLVPCPVADVPDAIQIYVRRIEWMDEKKLRHWNALGYFNFYPPPYFEERSRRGELFVYRNEANAIVGAVVLTDSDESWSDGASAYYVHNLVTDPSVRGVGRTMTNLVLAKARADGKRFLRLDCDASSAFLNRYYGELGFKPVGECAYGPYRGIRRQRELDDR